MKTSLFAVFVAGAAVLALTLAPVNGQGTDPKRDAVAQELEALRLQNDALGAELAATKGTIEQVVKYLEVQAESAKAMTAVLDDSELKGFTFGINPESRIALLAGWRAALDAQQKDVPTGKKPAKSVSSADEKKTVKN